MSCTARASRKDIAFAVRSLAASDVIRFMWSSVSFLDDLGHLTMSSPSCDPKHCSPLDTIKVARTDIGSPELEEHLNLPLHVLLHEHSGSRCVVHLTNANTSWFACQRRYVVDGQDKLPALDCNTNMFSAGGDIGTFSIPYSRGFSGLQPEGTCSKRTKVAVLPNRSVAVFGNSVNEAIMRTIYLNFALETMQLVESTGGDVQEASVSEQERQNRVWLENPTFSKTPEIASLQKKCDLPAWWEKIDLSEFRDDNVDELTLLAACDLAPSMTIARVGGRIFPSPSKYTIRLANNMHLHMHDGGGSNDSVFSFINHSFSPNVRCIPLPNECAVAFETLRHVKKGESLSFDYTTTEEPSFAAPFVDIETGKSVG